MHDQLFGRVIEAMATNRKYKIPDEMTPQHKARLTRYRMNAEWNRVLDMLEKGRRDPKGRTVTEVWADLVLANPGEEFARVSSMILPKEVGTVEGGNNVITSIQALYLTAVQKANANPVPQLVEHKPDDEW